MKRFYQLFLLFQMTAVLVFAFTMSAPVQAQVPNEEKNCHHCEMKVKNELKVHLDFYYEMLIEKYVPEQSEKWQEVRTERDLLYKKLKEAKKRGELLHGQRRDESWVMEHSDFQKSFKIAVEKRDEKQLQNLLPQMIAHYEKLNEHFKQRLNMTKSS